MRKYLFILIMAFMYTAQAFSTGKPVDIYLNYLSSFDLVIKCEVLQIAGEENEFMYDSLLIKVDKVFNGELNDTIWLHSDVGNKMPMTSADHYFKNINKNQVYYIRACRKEFNNKTILYFSPQYLYWRLPIMDNSVYATFNKFDYFIDKRFNILIWIFSRHGNYVREMEVPKFERKLIKRMEKYSYDKI